MDIQTEKRAIYKNVIVISLGFMTLFTAYSSVAALQSSINKTGGLGSYSLAATYLFLVLSTLFLSNIIIDKISSKWTMVWSMLCYSTYIAAQFYPTFLTLIPSASLVGIVAAPLWIAKCSYLFEAGKRYAALDGTPLDAVVGRMFGTFFFLFQCASIWGNIASSLILGSGQALNGTLTPLGPCGLYYCPAEPSDEVELAVVPSSSDNQTAPLESEHLETDPFQIYLLSGILLVSALLAPLALAVLVDPIERFSGQPNEAKDVPGCTDEKLTHLTSFESQSEEAGIFGLLFATFRHMADPRQALLVPITLWSGLEQGFFSADFTAGFVSCAFGVDKIGFVFIIYGITDAIGSFLFGYVIKYVGRFPIFLLGTVLNLVAICVMFAWEPRPEESSILFVIAALWGAADSIWQTQINALYGSLFVANKDAGFSNYRLWESLGFLAAFGLQVKVCIRTKLWILCGFLAVGMMGYVSVEYLQRRRRIGKVSPTENSLSHKKISDGSV